MPYYKTYLPNCNCRSGVLINQYGAVFCKWCRIPYGPGITENELKPITMTEKKYRLKKNIECPDLVASAGIIGVLDEKSGKVWFGEGKNFFYNLATVLSQTEYFEPMPLEVEKERCPYELYVLKYFGKKEDFDLRTELMIRYEDLVDLVCAFDQENSKSLQQQMDAARTEGIKEGFRAARLITHPYSTEYEFEKVEDFLSTLQSPVSSEAPISTEGKAFFWTDELVKKITGKAYYAGRMSAPFLPNEEIKQFKEENPNSTKQ